MRGELRFAPESIHRTSVPFRYTEAMIEALADLESSALDSLSLIHDASALEAWRVEHLGSKGALKSVMGMMKDVPKEQKPLAGQRANEVKQRLEAAF